MIKLIPKIELTNGLPRSLSNINLTDESDPMSLLNQLSLDGYDTVIIKDLDSISNHDNTLNINSILYLPEFSTQKLFIETNETNSDNCEMLIRSGIAGIFLYDFYLNSKNEFIKFISKFPDIIFGVGCNYFDGKIKFHDSDSNIYFEDFLKSIKNINGLNLLINFDRSDNYQKDLESVIVNISQSSNKILLHSDDLNEYNSEIIGVDKYVNNILGIIK